MKNFVRENSDRLFEVKMITFLKCFCKAFYENFLSMILTPTGNRIVSMTGLMLIIFVFMNDIDMMLNSVSDSMWEFRREKERCE